MPRTFVQLHRVLAAGLGFFILSHLAVHLTALGGPHLHGAVLGTVQKVYRNPIVEPLLVVAIGLQILVGARLVARRWRQPQKGFWGRTQIASGLFLAVFLFAHSSAAILTRHQLQLNSDFYWAAAPLQIAPYKYTFVPYYFLGVLSVFAHLASAVHFGWPRAPRLLAPLLLLSGTVVAGTIVATFAGAFYSIVLPQENLRYFERLGF